MNTSIITASYNEVINVDFTSDAWFNATSAAKQFNKRPNDWLNLDMTKEYIKLLHGTLFPDLPLPAKMVTAENQLVRTEKGGSVSDSIGGGGTWLHPELAVEFARWLSVGFSIWCNTTIRKILRGESIGGFEPAAKPIPKNPSPADVPRLTMTEAMCGHLKHHVATMTRQSNKTALAIWAEVRQEFDVTGGYRNYPVELYPDLCDYFGIEPKFEPESGNDWIILDKSKSADEQLEYLKRESPEVANAIHSIHKIMGEAGIIGRDKSVIDNKRLSMLEQIEARVKQILTAKSFDETVAVIGELKASVLIA